MAKKESKKEPKKTEISDLEKNIIAEYMDAMRVDFKHYGKNIKDRLDIGLNLIRERLIKLYDLNWKKSVEITDDEISININISIADQPTKRTKSMAIKKHMEKIGEQKNAD